MPQIWGWKLRLKSCSIVHAGVTAPATEGGQLILPVHNVIYLLVIFKLPPPVEQDTFRLTIRLQAK